MLITRLGVFVITFQIVVICVTFFMVYSTRSGQHNEVVNVLVNLRPLSRNLRQPPKLLLSDSVPLSNSTKVQSSVFDMSSSAPASTISGTVSELGTVHAVRKLSQSRSSRKPSPTQSTKPIVKRRYNTFLLIMVPILPDSISSRKLIRNTWYKGFNDSEEVMLRFAMGTKEISSNLSTQLSRESDIHKDMIFFENFKENRSALTNKTLLLINWAYENVNFTYYLKCDDDTFVFVKRTVAELMDRPTTTRLYYGKIQKGRPKKKNSPWQDPGWNLGDTYLPYALGGAYIISSDLIGFVAKDSEYLQWHPNEDTAVGSWLAPFKYERRDDDKICMFLDTDTKSKRCPDNQIIHLFYGMTPTELKERFLNLALQLT